MADIIRTIEVVDYDSSWPEAFQTYAAALRSALGDLIIGTEHVGSTSVPGLAAKPIIDLDVILSSRAVLTKVIQVLARLGYVHRGDLGIPGREAFFWPEGARHHLYVCSVDTPNLHNHLIFRDYLRAHPEAVDAYSKLKKTAAQQHTHDIDAYIEAKTAFIEETIARARTEYGHTF